MFEKVTEIVNLTPHMVNIWRGSDVIVIPTSGNVARIQIQSKNCGECCGVPVVRSTDRKVIGLPAPKNGTVFLVSSVVAKAVCRPDVLSPDTTDEGVIRDGNGNIAAVKRLQLFCDEVELL